MKRRLFSYNRWKILAVLLAVACGGYPALGLGAGGVVVPDQRIAIAPSGDTSGTWRGRDVTIDYRYSRDQGRLGIAGVLNFEDSIQYNYTLLQYFHADLIIADEGGNVLRTAPLLTAGQSGFGPEQFSTQIVLPPQAAFFAFSYTGQVIDNDDDGGGNPTSIWMYPIRR